MDVDRCVCCGEIVPEGTWVCWNCEQNGGPKPKANTPSELQVKLADKIADTLGIDFPWSSDEFTAEMYSDFINENISAAKRRWVEEASVDSWGDSDWHMFVELMRI